MNRSKLFFLGGLLSASLLLPAVQAAADQESGREHANPANHGLHKGWDKNHGDRFYHDEHDRRYYRHRDQRFYHHDVRGTRREIGDKRAELRKDYGELRKDRAELHRDLHNGAGKAEILKDRQEIRSDMKEIHGDRVDLRKAR
jgi:hypothetical protein